ncbi:hypothetical protein GGD67_005555 [Bradyrhizobium sp. IAR9]|uniref:hypothetical protein n=1 Tax=Bradyrhizobium sp. IAR9 TaxID=2663841 RepID=UPI00180873CD|nr:hypothetical protein [Bradyrhizobium sp. IAR9]NYG48072.1 hypothetical protein [Bradyrhizobium sp. IAR9]
MKDLRRRLEKLRSDAREFALMSQRATDVEKRELFKRLAEELAIEALELEQIVKQKGQSDPSARSWNCAVRSGSAADTLVFLIRPRAHNDA